MRRLLLLLMVLAGTSATVMAGPNEGGVLWVHDTGLAFTDDMTLPPVSPPPADCAGVDNEQPLDGIERIWKVYAAFPQGSAPRLKGTAWGIEFPEAAESPAAYVAIDALGCGLPDEDGPGTDFAVADHGFPTASGGDVGQSFLNARLAAVVELYYFAGYGTGGPVTFSVRPHGHPVNRYFVDDAVPQNADPIVGYSSLGFGQAGSTSCPAVLPVVACCVDDGSCLLLTPTACSAAGGAIYTGSCEPNPCLQPGACCFASGSCSLLQLAACVSASGTYLGGACDPNPCLQPGACCFASGVCSLLQPAECASAAGTYLGGACEPNPCPQPGACCFANGSCSLLQPSACLFAAGLYLGGACEPNPCPQPPAGACCLSSGACVIETELDCAGTWMGLGTTCSPNPCPQPGACCFPDGSCVVRQQASCALVGGDFFGGPCTPNPCPPPPAGACCFSSGICAMETELECAGSWMGPGTSCDPNPCPQPGACCLPDGACLIQLPAACAIAGGVSLGGPCSPNPCSPPAAGACCLAEASCSTLIPVDCATAGGRFLGGVCDPNPCLQPPPPPVDCPAGALLEVEDNGGCNSTPRAFQRLNPQAEGCATICGTAWATATSRDTDWYLSIGSGVPMLGTVTAAFPVQYILIYGTDCAAPDYVVATGAPGEPVTLSWTVAYGAPVWNWIGPSVFADWPESGYVLDVCGIESPSTSWGACCRNGLCAFVSPELCASAGGTFTAPGVQCDPSPCMPTAVESTSWGAIKARFSHPGGRPDDVVPDPLRAEPPPAPPRRGASGGR